MNTICLLKKKISTQTEHLSSEKLHGSLFYVLKIFLKKFKFFSLLRINIILVFSYHFNALIVKIICLKKIYTILIYFNIINTLKNEYISKHKLSQ